MSLQMSVDEREAFLAAMHVGVMAIERADGPPLAVPVWYSYEPGGEVVVLTGQDSLKQRLLDPAGRFSLCAQQEDLPYKYVTVEGAVTDSRDCTNDDTLAMAQRYLGDEMGAAYAAANGGGSLRVSMRPERWFTVDYGKS